MLGVANKDYDAAAIANEVMFRMFERNVVDKAKIRTIYKSETFPTTGYGDAHNLDPKLVEKIKEGLLHLPVGGLGAEGRVQGPGQVRADHLQEGLERDPQDRRGEPA